MKKEAKVNLKRKQQEPKEEAPREVIPVNEPPKESNPEPMVQVEAKKEAEPVVREKLPAVNSSATLPLNMYPSVPYEAPRPPLRTENPLLTPNGQLNYMLYNPMYVTDPIPDAFTPHFQQSAEVPRPIFNHCAIHAGIAYFIQAIQKREVLLLF